MDKNINLWTNAWDPAKITKMEDAGIDPATSRMLSARSTIWANPPCDCVANCQKHILKHEIKIFEKQYLTKLSVCKKKWKIPMIKKFEMRKR